MTRLPLLTIDACRRRETTTSGTAEVARLLAGFRRHLEDRSAHHLGYPYNLDFDFAPLAPFLEGLCINNLGDPFVESNYGVHSRPLEVAVLDWFTRIWDLGPGDYWGYVTSCGTEGNLHGLLVGREVFPDGPRSRTTPSSGRAARMYRVRCVKAPRVTFRKPGIGSVSVSGHKFLGCPVPCGVVITRREHAVVLSTDVEYLSSRDATITGSRNDHALLFLWCALNAKGRRGIRDDVHRCLRNARFLARCLRDAGVSAARLNPLKHHGGARAAARRGVRAQVAARVPGRRSACGGDAECWRRSTRSPALLKTLLLRGGSGISTVKGLLVCAWRKI
ncbi:unnamed protein product [Miscanthus lutarioriparius]|uniref:Histidine decarboxylase n=1 Tax=Miscanthus lutarioriparius TaxID=422564 RepID=A0A811P2H9_9POAL|nr:unnamed protein product [Miscanthus lutarioriparius]